MLTALTRPLQVNENLTIYPFVPVDAGQGWKLELFELAEPIREHCHMVLVTEGELQAIYGSEEPVLLRSGELAQVKPGIVHSLIPKGTMRFFSIDFPSSDTEFFPPLDSKYFGERIDLGDYAVYEFVPGSATEKKWSAALLEIQNSPRHFHLIEREIFIVVNGQLDIEVDGIHHLLKPGESIVIDPKYIHQLKSAGENPVRVLCFNFPAFDPADMHLP